MILLGLVASLAGFAGLIAWHMQRPDPQKQLLSFARFLPDPPPDAPEAPRFALRLPWHSAGFWLRVLAALLLALALFFPWLDGLRLPASAQVGLRVILDVSASMQVASAKGTRMTEALEEVTQLTALARAAAGGGRYCDEIIPVAQSALAPISPIPEIISLEAQPMGADPAILVDAARIPPAACPPTHVVIVTDQPSPLQLPEFEGLPLAWRQVGTAAANLGLRGASWRGPDLLGSPARLTLEVLASGPLAAAPELNLTGPAGTQTLALDPARDRDDLWRAEVISPVAGAYSARLTAPGAFTGDDRLDFTLTEAKRPGVDWRLAMPRPGAIAEDQNGFLVARLGEADPTGRPALLTYPGWNAAQKGQIGAFVDDPLITGTLNLDLFEDSLPGAFAGLLPEGFQPILSDAQGGVLVARRAVPPGLLLPEPLSAGPDAAATLSQILFFSALAELATPQDLPLAQAWFDAKGAELPQAFRESDTGRALRPGTLPDFAPAPPASGALDPLWSDIALAALVLLAFDRLLILGFAFLRRRHAV